MGQEDRRTENDERLDEEHDRDSTTAMIKDTFAPLIGKDDVDDEAPKTNPVPGQPRSTEPTGR